MSPPSRRTAILCVAGTRPNFVKIASIMKSVARRGTFDAVLVHTGQHYDDALSGVFFEDLQIPRPHVELQVGSATHAVQTAELLGRFEPVLEERQPAGVLVVGDVNSTLACALATAKFQLRRPFAWRGGLRRRPVVIHVEAGLRSFDDEMPEEVNRRLTDGISDVLFVSEPSGLVNLRREGVPDDRVFFVGNVMIDTLLATRDRAGRSRILDQLGLTTRDFGLVTLHRPSNVDDPSTLAALLATLDEVAARLPLVFPVHPRTRQRISALGFVPQPPRWTLTDSLGYLDFLKLQASARLVLTDSGGVQEETTILGVPCLTLRDNTERPVTIDEGTNILAGTSRPGILRALETALTRPTVARVPRHWDGHAADRAVDALVPLFAESGSAGVDRRGAGVR